MSDTTKNLELHILAISRATGMISQVHMEDQFIDRTTNPDNTVSSYIPKLFRGGDVEATCGGSLYASSLGMDGQSLYFKLEPLAPMSDTMTGFAYYLIATGTNNQEPQELVVNSELAYTNDGLLIAHNTASGRTTVVTSPDYGTTGYIGTEGVDYIIFRDDSGAAIGFSDMASSRTC